MMEFKNTAEGIEDHATYEKLRNMGCQYGQGYYWCHPMPNNRFIEKVKNWDTNNFT